MKKILTVIVLVVLSAATASAEEMMNIRCENVEIDVPVGWLAQYTKTPTLFILYSPMELNDSFQENCNLTMEFLPASYSVQDYMDASVEALKLSYTDFVRLETNENYHIITGTVGNISLKQIQYFFVRDNTGYVLSFSSTPKSFERYREEFIKIAKTFKLRKS